MSAFEDAQAGGVIDLFLSMPDSKEKQARKFDNIRRIANDAESKEMAMPAQYMFKGVPTYDQVDDPVALALGEMDKHNVRRALMAVHENEHAQRASTMQDPLKSGGGCSTRHSPSLVTRL